MATFAATVERLIITKHNNADALELAEVGAYQAIVRKGDFETGDLGVYIPEQSIVPDWLIKRLGLEGRLAGKQKNRVKAVKLRGVLSQGLIVPCPREIELEWAVMDADKDNGFLTLDNTHEEGVPAEEYREVTLGDDVTELLGITKWEPVIPALMSGEVYNPHFQFKYDIENFKRHPDVLEDAEEVVMTEKIHGTFCMVAHLPVGEWSDDHLDQRWVVASKGLAAQGIALKPTEENLAKNTYFRALITHDVFRKLRAAIDNDEKVVVLGEVYGRGIQDLQYGNESDNLGFRVFDIYVEGLPMPHDVMQVACQEAGLETVPVLYEGPFGEDVMEEVTNGKETISGDETHTREGVVIKPLNERRDNEIGRVILKSVSEAYLLRKGDTTEFN